MKHVTAVSKKPARASDSQTISPSIIITFIVAILTALAPILTAVKTPTLT